MNFKVGQASRLPKSAKPTEDHLHRLRCRASWAGETPALLCCLLRFMVPMHNATKAAGLIQSGGAQRGELPGGKEPLVLRSETLVCLVPCHGRN